MSRPGIGRRVRACAALGSVASLVCALAFTASAQAQLGDRTLKVGSKGSDVKAAQRALTAVGIKTKADGVYGAGTARNVKRWERSEHRRADGKLQPSDAKELESQAGDGTGLEDPSSGDASTGTGGAAYSTSGPGGARATLGPDGRTATAPDSAPQQVKDAISAANSITNKPYKYGGGHGSWTDSGYDCSGSVSFALHGAGLIDMPMSSYDFPGWGQSGPGQWVTVYGMQSHAYMVVAGIRFDTSASKGGGSRWTTAPRSSAGYTAVHLAGL
jgi:peptidoglycan hydrolase-like protein with peptidoglycan-binding domain